MKCLFWWTCDGLFDEQEYANPKTLMWKLTLMWKFTALLKDGNVSVVMAEVHKNE